MRTTHRDPLLVLLAAILVAAAVQTTGVRGRTYLADRSVVRVSGSQAAFAAWRASGVKGRLLVYFRRHPDLDRQRSYEVLDARAGEGELPVRDSDLVSGLIAMGIVRAVYHVVPDGDWSAVEAAMRARDDVIRSGRTFRVRVDGAPIFVLRSADLPQLEEKALVYVDAGIQSSYDLEAVGRWTRDPALSDSVLIGAGG